MQNSLLILTQFYYWMLLVYNGKLGQSQLSNYGFFVHGEDARKCCTSYME